MTISTTFTTICRWKQEPKLSLKKTKSKVNNDNKLCKKYGKLDNEVCE